MKAGQKLWSREELILAINLYCKMPFGKIHHGNPLIVNLAMLIDRTPSAVAFKLSNFASFDPSLQARGIKGASNASKLDYEIWNEFYEHWDSKPFESEKLLAEYKHTTVEASNGIEEEDLHREGKTREQIVKTRVNQNFFRSMIMAAYNNKCCITGIHMPEFLIAGHISPWGKDERNRLNPRNGIAINAIHDKAFEIGYLTITPEYQIKISSVLLNQPKNEVVYDYFIKYHNRNMFLPTRFLPDPEFLKYHNHERFIK
jgi:putative restriction endonuclease